MKNKILITDGLAPAGLALLKKQKTIQIINSTSSKDDVRGLIIKTATKVDKNYLNKFKNLKLVCRVGIGVDHIDLKTCSQKGITVINTPEGNRLSTAEHTLALIFSLAKKITQADRNLKSGSWDRQKFKGIELFGKTLGIIGLGRIGREVAKRAQALGMNVVACDPYLDAKIAKAMGIPLLKLQDLAKCSDFITLHVPLTKETKGMVNQKLLKIFKKQSFLINASRGAVVKEKDLVKALQSGWVSGAALDVFEQEPLANRSKLRLNNQVILTPHVAGQSVESEKRLAVEAAESVIAFFVKGMTRNKVN